jgi:ketosteroid isomerase-like protein
MAALVTAAMLVYFMSLGKTPADTQEPRAQDKDESVSRRREAFIETYNRGDARAVAGFWAPDADYVDEDGHAYKGREAMEPHASR